MESIKTTNLSKSLFTDLILEIVQTKKMPYLDAIVYFCEENELEIEDVVKYVSPVIKNKLEAEAMDLNLLPRQSQLPI